MRKAGAQEKESHVLFSQETSAVGRSSALHSAPAPLRIMEMRLSPLLAVRFQGVARAAAAAVAATGLLVVFGWSLRIDEPFG